MTNHVVCGVLVPDATSGHPALELVNTRAGWGEPSPREYLVSYDALAVWAADVGHLTAGELRELRALAAGSTAEAARVLHETLALREAYYDVLRADVPAARDLDQVQAAAVPAFAASGLVVDAAGRIRPDGGRVAAVGLRLPLHRAVLAAVHLLAAGDAAHVRACAGTGCGWVFLDRTHRKRWCTMAICGNRAKARAYAARRSADRGRARALPTP